MNRFVQQTSIESYHNQPHLCEDQATVLIAINIHPDSTDRELTRYLGKTDPNFERPRRKELVDLGLVECSDKRVCKVTGKKAMTWRVKQ